MTSVKKYATGETPLQGDVVERVGYSIGYLSVGDQAIVRRVVNDNSIDVGSDAVHYGIEQFKLIARGSSSTPSREWLSKMADAEDKCQSVSVGTQDFDIFGWACRNLPSGYDLSISIENGSGMVILNGPDGEAIDDSCYDETPMSESITRLVDLANEKEQAAKG